MIAQARPAHAPIHISDLRWHSGPVAWRTDDVEREGLGTGPVARSAGETYGLLSIIPMCDSGDRDSRGVVLLAPRDETPLLQARLYAIIHQPTRACVALAVSGAAARRWVETAMTVLASDWYTPHDHKATINALIESGQADGLLMRDAT